MRKAKLMSALLSFAMVVTTVFSSAGIQATTAKAMTGTGTSAADPYTISSYADLAQMSTLVQKATGDVYFKLTANINAAGETYQTPSNGSARVHLDGNGKTISNLTSFARAGFASPSGRSRICYGLFGHVATLEATDLTLSKCALEDTEEHSAVYAGILAGDINTSSADESSKNNIRNVSLQDSRITLNFNNGSAETASSVGALVGYLGAYGLSYDKGLGKWKASITNTSVVNTTLTNVGISTSPNGSMGLLAGMNYWQMTNCSTEGTMTFNGLSQYGGLVGMNYSVSKQNADGSYSYLTSIKDCTADVTLKQDPERTDSVPGSAGGLVGLNSGLIENSTATGDVTASAANVGGFVGENSTTGTINGKSASGNVKNTSDRDSAQTGGIAGSNRGTIKNMESKGTVEGKNNVGGIVGENYSSGVVDSCTNESPVKGENNVGGIAGENQGTVSNCTNKKEGTVDGDSNVGGIAGKNSGELSNNTNEGAATGNTNVGGIAGDNSGAVTGNTNTKDGTVNGDTNVGGIAGKNSGVLSDNINEADVNGKNNVGGINGKNEESGVVKDNTNNGSVAGDTNVGGIVGDNSGTQRDNTNNGTVNGTTNVGGNTGHNESTGSVSNEKNHGDVYGKDNVGGNIGNNEGSAKNNHNDGDIYVTKDGTNAGGNDGSNTGTDSGSSSTKEPTTIDPAPGDTVINPSTPADPSGKDIIPGYGPSTGATDVYGIQFYMTPAGAGSLSLSSLDLKNKKIGMTATAAAGYKFSGWVVKGASKFTYVSTDATHVFDGTKDTVVIAVFYKSGDKDPKEDIEKIDIAPATTNTPAPAPGTTTSPLPAYNPASGPVIVGPGTPINTTVTIAGITGTVSTVMAFGMYISVSPATGGSISLAGTTPTTINLSATPNKGFTFSHWVVDGQIFSKNTAETFTIVPNKQITAVFTLDKRTFVEGKYEYYITNIAKKTVRLNGAANGRKNYKKITVYTNVKHNGVKYKVVSVKSGAFKKFKKATVISIGKNVKTIGSNAFYGCKKVKKVIIKSKKVKKIKKGAFKKMKKGCKMYLPASKFKKYKKMVVKSRPNTKIKYKKLK